MACLPANARKIGRPEARSERKDRVFWNFKALFFFFERKIRGGNFFFSFCSLAKKFILFTIVIEEWYFYRENVISSNWRGNSIKSIRERITYYKVYLLFRMILYVCLQKLCNKE